MIKVTCGMHSHQKWAFGETKDVERRVFYGEDEFDIMRQQDEIVYAWFQDPAVKSVWFEEISREELGEDPKYIIDTDDIEISDGNHYLTNLTLSKDSVELPIVGDKSDAIQFDDINQAQAIASYVGGRVEELEQ